jgi:hypothetical protein
VAVESYATSQPVVVGGEAVLVRAGPGPDFPLVAALGSGRELVATGTARGDGGSSWLAVTVPGGGSGFVPDGMVRPRIDPPRPVAAAASIPAVASGKPSTVASQRAETGRTSRRKAAPKAQPPSASTVPCILPSGAEVQAGYAECRARGGVIYR